MIILKKRSEMDFGTIDVRNEDKNFTAVIECGNEMNYGCLFHEICLHAAAVMLHADEKGYFDCPRKCQFHREGNTAYLGEYDIVVFPGDAPCYALPSSALRNAKRLAPDIILKDKENEAPKKQEDGKYIVNKDNEVI